MDTSPEPVSAAPSIWSYVWLGVLAHVLWGSYPVLAKRALAEVPKFSLLFLASASAMLVGAWLLQRREHMSWRRVGAILRRERVLWALALVVALRSVTNIVSIELTHAIWVQLINILTPFPVAILGVLFFDEPTPRYTYRALLLSTTGAVLMLVQDWSQVWAGITPRDGWGLLFAIVSTLALATYFQLVRRSHLRHAGSSLILFQQGVAMSTAFLSLSFLTGEDWGAWTSLSAGGWLAALAVMWLVQVGGNLLQITAVGGVSPALVTSLMALRLVSALLLAGLILGEQLVAPTQWLGAALVVVTVTLYLWLQHRARP